MTDHATAPAATETIIALYNATEGRDAEFNEWYTGTHLPEVVALPGIVSAQRYELPEPLVGQLPYRYATLYTVEGSAAAATQRIYTGGLGMSDSIDTANMIFAPFAPLGAPIAAQ